jgi:DNA-binding NarL/FixJ family response regulator
VRGNRKGRGSVAVSGAGLLGIRTAIVCDGNPLVRAGVRRTLEMEYGIGVAEETDDGAAAADLMTEHDAAVMVIEDRLCDDAIADRGRACSVVILAEDIDADRLLALLESGVRAVVCRSGSRQDMVRAVHSVIEGGGFIAPEFAGAVIGAVRAGGPGQHARHRPELAALTVRERAVLDDVCKGMTNREIASALKVSEKTVKFHVSNVLAKMEVRSRAQLIANLAGAASHQAS